MARKKNYINNKDMYNALCDYLNKYSECIEQQKETPRIPDYIGQAFYLLCEELDVSKTSLVIHILMR